MTAPRRLTEAQAALMWTVAQHIHGWAHASGHRGSLRTADSLVRRGLVVWGVNGRDHTEPKVVATAAGRALIHGTWPKSPYVLGTYEPQTGDGNGYSAPVVMPGEDGRFVLDRDYVLDGVHARKDCSGPPCVIHHPTPHHMAAWPISWRADRGIFERHCREHGVGHPDPDQRADTLHGCCGCCAPPAAAGEDSGRTVNP